MKVRSHRTLSLLAAALLMAAAAGSLAWVLKLRAEAERSRLNIEIIHTASGEAERLDRVRLSGIAAGGDTAAQLREFTGQRDRVAQLLREIRGGDEAGLADLRSALAHYVADGARQLELVYRGYTDAARLVEVDEVRPAYGRLNSAFEDADSRLDGDELRSQRLADRISLALLAVVILLVGGAGLRSVRSRRATGEALAHSERRWRALVRHGYDLVGLVGSDGRISYASESVERILGFGETELLGREFGELVHPDDLEFLAGRFAELADGGPTTGGHKIRMRHADGGWRLLEVAVSNRLADPDVGALVVNARDVTELHETEEQLRQAQRIEAVGRLAGGVAHDFNNLLTVMIGSADVALARLPEGDAGRIELEEIRAASERAADLTRQLLAFGRKQVLLPETFELDAAVVRTGQMLRRLIGEHVELVVLPGGGAARVRVDAGQLEQVLVNLAVNARDAMPDGGTLTIATGTKRLDEPVAGDGAELPSGEYASLSVRDTGTGMDEKTLDRIFEPFFTTKHDGAGTGLGLATSHGIVAQSGGTMKVESEPGHGSVFTVLLPLADAPAAETPARQAPPAPSVRPAAATVLVAEDEPAVRGLVVAGLERAGYTVLGASEGDEALALAHGHEGPIDLLMTDIVMPGMSGRALAERLAAERPGLPVLYTSGYPAGALGSEDVSAPGAGFLQKPFTLAELTAAVAGAIAADTLAA